MYNVKLSPQNNIKFIPHLPVLAKHFTRLGNVGKLGQLPTHSGQTEVHRVQKLN